MRQTQILGQMKRIEETYDLQVRISSIEVKFHKLFKEWFDDDYERAGKRQFNWMKYLSSK